MPYFLDENLSQVSAQIARDAGVDAISSHEANMDGCSDVEQLRFAAAQRRILVTRDRGDMGRALDELAALGEPHAGVLFVPRSIRLDDLAGVALALIQWDREHADGVPADFVGYLRNPRLSQ